MSRALSFTSFQTYIHISHMIVKTREIRQGFAQLGGDVILMAELHVTLRLILTPHPYGVHFISTASNLIQLLQFL